MTLQATHTIGNILSKGNEKDLALLTHSGVCDKESTGISLSKSNSPNGSPCFPLEELFSRLDVPET